MKYLSLPSLLEARKYISEHTKKSDTFAGMMLFLFCVVKAERNGTYLTSDMKLFSEFADEAFYLSDNEITYQEKYWYAFLTNDWIEQVKEYFLKDEKISLSQVLYALFWRKDYNTVKNLLNKIPSNIIEKLFVNDFSSDRYSDSVPISSRNILHHYGISGSNPDQALTIKFDGSFVKKKAGDLSGAPFGQTLYAGTEIKKIISVYDFDFIKKFNLDSSSQCTNIFSPKNNSSHSTNILPKPFLLLAGISGTGKTRFVREQAKASGSLSSTYCLTSVRPDWHEPSDLLGYISRLNGPAQYITTDVLQFVANAWRAMLEGGLVLKAITDENQGERLVVSGERTMLDAVLPYWLCLDEMNLAPVEQYFADYLSVLETRDWIWNGDDFIYACDPLLKASTIEQIDNKQELRQQLGFADEKYDDDWQLFCKHGLGIPLNLIVAGTVNMDETTHGFSRKVIDRALTFDFGEFFPNDFNQFFEPDTQNKTLTYPLLTQARIEDLVGTADEDGKKSIAFLTKVNAILDGTPFKLAFRALNELLIAVISQNPQDELTLKAVWDDFLMSKVLPRIEGDSDKLDDSPSLLEKLTLLLKDELKEFWGGDDSEPLRPDLYREYITESEKVILITCRSREKLAWMQSRLDTAGFTSFWP